MRKRPIRWGRSFVVASAVAGAVAGCTSLLGDFTTGPGTGSSGEGGPDGQAPVEASDDGGDDSTVMGDDGGVIGDAGEAGDGSDGSVPLLDCGTWAYPTPITLETLTTGNRLVQGALTIYAIPQAGGGSNVRVVAGKNGNSPFSVYSLDRSQTPPLLSTIGPSTTYFQAIASAVHRSPGKASTYTVVLAYTRASAAVSATYEAFVLQDTLANAGTIPSPFPVYQLTPVQATPNSMHILPLATTDLFLTIENPSVSGGVTTYNYGAGIATTAAEVTTLAPISQSFNLDDFTEGSLFHNSVNNTVYVYNQNDVSSPGLSSWALSDTVPTDAGMPTKRPIGAISAFMPSIAENTTASSADIAYVESTLTGNFVTSIAYRAGTIPYTAATPDLDTWVSTDLPLVRNYTNVFDAPTGLMGTSGSRWASDNIMLLGPGAKAAASVDASNGGVPYGLNMIWMDATGTLKSEARGATRLMPTLGDFTGVAAAPITLGNGPRATARWALAWVEAKTDEAGTYDVVSYNELICQ
jgi:hypothetical protein